MAIRLRDLAESEREFLAVLEAFSGPISDGIIKALLPLTEGEIEKIKSKLSKTGWLETKDGNIISLSQDIPAADIKRLIDINNKDRLNEIVDHLNDLDLFNKIIPDLLLNLLKRSGRPKEVALFAIDSAQKDIKVGEFERAMGYYLNATSHLIDYLDDNECKTLLIMASLNLSDLFVNVRKKEEEVLKTLRQARNISEQIGDDRHNALINLHIGRTYHIIHRPLDALDFLNLGLNAIERIGDKDIREQSAEFFGIFYFMHGMAKEATEYFDQALSANIYRKGQLFNGIIPIYLGSCSAFMGQFYRAIGVMDAAWRRALLNSDNLFAAWYRAHLGNMLLMAGKKQEAVFHLQEAQKEAVLHNNIYALVWAQRALSYYYLLQGQTVKSYHILKHCLANAAMSDVKRPHYALPWVLDLLFEYHKQGYKPISEYDFEQEMDSAINGINIHLRGTAYRIRAKQAQISGQDLSKVEKLLKKSEADHMKVRDPVELAKTKAELAMIKLRGGHKKEALDLALKAWEGLSAYELEFFPAQLRSLIQSYKIRPKRQGNDLLQRYMEMIEGFIPSTNQDELLSYLIAATSRFFEAERGAIFLLDDHKDKSRPILSAAYNLTREDVDKEEFRSNLSYILKSHRDNRPFIVQLPKSYSRNIDPQFMTILCLPLDMGKRLHGVLYYDNTYSSGTFEILDKSMLKKIAQNVAIYIMRISEYCQQIEQKSLSAIAETTAIKELKGMEILGQSRVIRDLVGRADRAAGSDDPVLILGETGSGKELLARRIHHVSSRRTMPFIAFNLTSIPETLVESELFGHEKGAFTGADRQKLGRMELADKGTLFIDEIGDTPISIQVKLLRALEEKSFFRIGGTRNFSSDFRLIVATNRDIVKLVERGTFRQDLYYRLSVLPLIVPALRKRGNDIILLAQHFLSIYAKKYNRPVPELTSEDKARLKAHQWPGNVRELKNTIAHSITLSNGGDFILHIPEGPKTLSPNSDSSYNLFSDTPTIDELQRRYIRYVLKKANGKLSGPGGAAEILGMKRTTLYTRIKRLGLSPNDY